MKTKIILVLFLSTGISWVFGQEPVKTLIGEGNRAMIFPQTGQVLPQVSTGNDEGTGKTLRDDQVIQLTAYAPGPDQPGRKLKTSAPDLIPYKPSGWSDKIVVSKTTGTNTDDLPLYPTDILYVDWAVLNQGNLVTAGSFHIGLEVDGVRIAAWIFGNLNLNTYTWAVDRIVGPLTAGTHTLKLVADYLNEVTESNESNNEYTRTITISPPLPDLTPQQPSGWSDKIVVSKVTGTHSDDSPLYPTDNLYVDWAVGNLGGTATAARFYTALYVDGTLKNTWFTDPPLNAGAFSFAADYDIGKLAAGNHTIKIVVDNTGTVSESTETNNEYTKTIAISQYAPDLAPFKPSGWSDFIVASIVTGTTTDAVTIYPTDNIYLDWAVVNLGNSGTTARFYIALYVDGTLKTSTYKDPPLDGHSYVYKSDYYLGVLAAGTHTIKIVADDTGTITESDETNNEYTKTITVVQNNLPDLTFYKPASWSDKLVASTVPGTNKDAATIYPTDFIYIDWVVTNQGTAATAARYSTTLYIEGILNSRFITDPPVNANSIHYYLDFGLGNLPAGTYTMRMVIDVDGTIAESDETNNEYSRTLIVSSGSSNHFIPVWSGTFYRPMIIVVKQAELAGTALVAGDEIGVYDGSMCVGMGKLMQSIDPSTPDTHLYITVSKNEGSGNGYTEGNTITYRMWDSSLDRESETITGVYPGPPFNSSVFKVGDKTIVELTGRWAYEQQIRLVSGWNLVSSAVIPDLKSIRDVMNSLIDRRLLYKVIDEKGNMLQKMSWGWDNSIGDIAPTEGYYVNVTGNCELSVIGATVQMPFSIPLRTGWNLMGYPSLIRRDAQTFFSSITGIGEQYKVIDDEGNILQRMPWGWVNTIGDLQAGEGYCIKVLRDVTVQFTSSPVFPGGGGYKTGDLGSPGTCFKAAHTGNPYKPVHLMLTGLESLDPGDEVGVFQGNLCVGSGLYSGQDRLILVASADDPTTAETDGYIDGGEFEFRIWRSGTGREFTGFEVTDEVGTKQFKEMDTYAGKLQLITDPESLFPYLEQNFPNPATQCTSIVYGIPQTGHVSIRLFDLSGKQIQSLFDQEQTKGRYQVDFSTSGLRQGIYYYRFEFTTDRKASQITRNMVITN